MNIVNQLTHLVYQFGPFAFALIFLIFMARWGQNKWQEACTREKPPAAESEKMTYLQYFIGVTLVGVVLMGVSVYWWWTHQPVYFYEGAIDAISETESIEGQGVFVHNEYYQQGPGSPQFRDVHLMIIQREPFNEGQQINLRYFRDRSLTKPLVLTVNLNEHPSFTLEYDQTKDNWRLRKKGNAVAGWFDLFASAYAQVARQVSPTSAAPVSIPRKTVAPAILPLPDGKPQLLVINLPQVELKYQNFVQELQDSKTLGSRKVAILDSLLSASTDVLAKLFSMRSIFERPLSEPVFVTLMDLTRHTDKEIASKAIKLLSRAPLPTDYFSSALSSKDPKRLSDAMNQYLRLEPKYADSILLSLATLHIDVKPLQQISREGDHWKLLVPTGTATGDKYFAIAEWKDEDKTNKCVSTNGALALGLRGENSAPGNIRKSPWNVSDDDKFRILKFATDIEHCGGKTKFVGFYPRETIIRIQN